MRTLLLCLSACLLLVSCIKSDTRTWRGSIAATVDGTDTTFTSSVNASYGRSSASGKESITISAFKQVTGDGISLYISNVGKIVPGVYSQTDSVRYVYLDFTQKELHYPFMSDATSSNPAIVTINSITDTQIEGTFSGDTYLLTYVNNSFYYTAAKKVITNGTFSLNYQ